MNYLHLYSSITEHDADYYGENYHEPWTAYIQENNEVTYNIDYRNTDSKELYTEFKRVNRNPLTEEEEELFKNYIVHDSSCSCADCEAIISIRYLYVNGKSCVITYSENYSCLGYLKTRADSSMAFTWRNSEPSGCGSSVGEEEEEIDAPAPELEDNGE